MSPSLLITSEARTSLDDAAAGAPRGLHLASSFFDGRGAGGTRQTFKRGLDFDAVQDHEQLSMISTGDFMLTSCADPAPAVLTEVRARQVKDEGQQRACGPCPLGSSPFDRLLAPVRSWSTS